MSRGRLSPPTVVAILVLGCGGGDPASDEGEAPEQEYASPAVDVRGEYERFVRRWFAAYNRRDVGALASFYAPDAIRMPPGAPAQRGPDAIREGLAETFAALEEVRTEGASQQVHFQDGWAVERGTYTVESLASGDTARTVERGKYVVVARRDETGGWRIVWEIWNANADAAERLIEPE